MQIQIRKLGQATVKIDKIIGPRENILSFSSFSVEICPYEINNGLDPPLRGMSWQKIYVFLFQTGGIPSWITDRKAEDADPIWQNGLQLTGSANS
jgi:hypothetical protein